MAIQNKCMQTLLDLKGMPLKFVRDTMSVADGHIIQELALPHDRDPNREYCLRMISKGVNPQVAEVSIQYVFDRSDNVIGRMASYNKLNNGIPIEILPIEDDAMWTDVEKLLPALVELGARGPVNLQGRITNKGIKIFEINARFTGITGLRAALGFNEVEACIRHWLTDEPMYDLKINQGKAGIRQTADKVIAIDQNEEVAKISKGLNGIHLKTKKTLLVTGSTGSIGRRLVCELVRHDYEVWTLDRDKVKAKQLFETLQVESYDWSDLDSGILSLASISCRSRYCFQPDKDF